MKLTGLPVAKVPTGTILRSVKIQVLPAPARVMPFLIPFGATTVNGALGAVVPIPTLPEFVLLMFWLASAVVHCACTAAVPTNRKANETMILGSNQRVSLEEQLVIFFSFLE